MKHAVRKLMETDLFLFVSLYRIKLIQDVHEFLLSLVQKICNLLFDTLARNFETVVELCFI